jgi:hypothetical protein
MMSGVKRKKEKGKSGRMKRVVGHASLHPSTFKSVSPGAEANAPTPGHWFRYEAALGVIDPEITCSNCLECSHPDPLGGTSDSR